MAELARGMRRRIGRAIGGGSGDGKARTGRAAMASKPMSPTGKGPTLGKMKRAKPPNVYGRGPLVGSGQLGVVLVAIVKNEGDYLEEWLAYHIALGVDHFLIYDNGSTDHTPELLERYLNHGLVTYIAWPMRAGQISAYNHSLRFFGHSARWMAYYDPDEFLVPLQDDDIPSLLARFEDHAARRTLRCRCGRARSPGS